MQFQSSNRVVSSEGVAMYEYFNIDPFIDYRNLFVQPWPKYGLKHVGQDKWKTRFKMLGNRAIREHLDGNYWVGSIARWYPEFALLDFDDCTEDKIDRVRTELGLDDSKAMLMTSESDNSYHLLFRPVYDNQPPTARLLMDVFREYCLSRQIEIYPQANRFVRLPFGHAQVHCLNEGMEHLNRWEDLVYYFRKLDEFELKNIDYMNWEHRFIDDDDDEHIYIDSSILFSSGTGTASALELIEHGLQAPGTRNYAQGLIITYLFRKGVPPKTAVRYVWDWIKSKHNGMSKDFPANPKDVAGEIKRQVKSVYRTGHRQRYYPDLTDISHNGWITKENLTHILVLTSGNMPRTKFTYKLVSYCNPRSVRDSISLHSNKLVLWSGARTYKKYLAELEKAGMVKRGNIYVPGLISKPVRLLNWKHQAIGDAILKDERTPDIEVAYSQAFEREELKKILRDQGVSRQNIYSIIRKIYG